MTCFATGRPSLGRMHDLHAAASAARLAASAAQRTRRADRFRRLAASELPSGRSPRHASAALHATIA
jgi:hypothetical protein